VDVISARERAAFSGYMLINTVQKVVRHPTVKRSVLSRCQEVYKVVMIAGHPSILDKDLLTVTLLFRLFELSFTLQPSLVIPATAGIHREAYSGVVFGHRFVANTGIK